MIHGNYSVAFLEEKKSYKFMVHEQSDPPNSYSLNSSFSLNSFGKFENFGTIIIDANVKLPC